MPAAIFPQCSSDGYQLAIVSDHVVIVTGRACTPFRLLSSELFFPLIRCAGYASFASFHRFVRYHACKSHTCPVTIPSCIPDLALQTTCPDPFFYPALLANDFLSNRSPSSPRVFCRPCSANSCIIRFPAHDPLAAYIAIYVRFYCSFDCHFHVLCLIVIINIFICFRVIFPVIAFRH